MDTEYNAISCTEFIEFLFDRNPSEKKKLSSCYDNKKHNDLTLRYL